MRTTISAPRTDTPTPRTVGRRLIVTIDGPAGAGKSTVARQLATKLGYLYLDTGALYRAVAWRVRAAGVDPGNEQAVAALLPATQVMMDQHRDGVRVTVNGTDITAEIRTPDISTLASKVSALPTVREWLLPVQQRVAERGGVVAEGRDLGTRVFPGAEAKFFLDADVSTRAARRQQDLTGAGNAAGLAQTQQEIEARDQRDRSRALAPLAPAADAEQIDSSSLTVEQVLARMLATIATKL
ncbi:MAG: (d)CMP kinase [Nitrospira sp.]